MKKTKWKEWEELNFFKFNGEIISVSNETIKLMQSPPVEVIPIHFQIRENNMYSSREGAAIFSKIEECSIKEVAEFFNADISQFNQSDL